jgi:hypothetical protein
MKRKCRGTNQEFLIAEEDLDFYNQLKVPPPTLCPDERQRRRLAFRNERTLYRRTCSSTGAKLLSIYSPDKPFPVYENDYWWSDSWDAKEFGRDFDFNRPFFEQFNDLQQVVPHCALMVVKPSMENSDYCNQVGFIKDCYLIFDSRRSEKCMYSKTVERSYDCLDCLKAFDCEACYESVAIQNCKFSTYLFDSYNCSECHYCSSLIGCSNCFGCTNLRNKQYYFYNERCQPEVWKRKVTEILADTPRSRLLDQFDEFRGAQFVKWMRESNTDNCTGDYLIDSKDCEHCFDCEYMQNCKYCYDLKKDTAPNYKIYDVCHFGGNVEYCYECCSIGNTVSQICFCENVWSCSDIWYSRLCTQSENLFGCVGMKNAKYCILNKQYSEEEYWKLRERISEHMQTTGEWGEFFPINLSPFGYNETLACEYFPLSKQEVLGRGWKWKEEEAAGPISNPYRPPEKISEVSDDILNKVLKCEQTGRAYRITKAELQFYRKMNIPLPKLCFEARHQRRMAGRNPRKLYLRRCSETGREILTTYSPDRPEPVLSHKAYLQAVE